MLALSCAVTPKGRIRVRTAYCFLCNAFIPAKPNSRYTSFTNRSQIRRKPRIPRRQCAKVHASASPPFGETRAPKPGEIDRLLREMDSDDPGVRLKALLQCRDLPPEDAAPVICKMFDNNEPELQCRGIGSLFLGYKPNPRSAPILTSIVENPDEVPEVVANAVAALGYLKDPVSIPLFLRLIRNPQTHWSTRTSALVSIGIVAEAVPSVRGIVFDDLLAIVRSSSEDDIALQSAIGALGDVGDTRCVPYISKYIKSDDFPFAQSVCEALGKLPCPESKTALQDVVDDGTAHVNVLWGAEIALKAVSEAMTGK